MRRWIGRIAPDVGFRRHFVDGPVTAMPGPRPGAALRCWDDRWIGEIAPGKGFWRSTADESVGRAA